MPTNTVERLSFSGVSLLDAPDIFHSEPQWRWKTQIPEYYNLWYVISGRGSLECDGVRSELHPGSGFILGPGQHIDAQHDPRHPIVNFAAHFVPVRNGRDALAVPELPLDATQATNPSLFAELARAAVACGRIGDGLAEQQQAGLIYQLISMLWRSHQQPSPDPIDEHILAHIEQMRTRPGQRLSIPKLAAKAHLSCSQYTRRFARLTGSPPNRFMMKTRIHRACMLLRDSPLSIEEVSEALEYQDAFFFSRQFKKVMGLSPKSYLESIRA